MLEQRRLRWRTSLTFATAILLLSLLLTFLVNWLIQVSFARLVEDHARAGVESVAAQDALLQAWSKDESANLQAVLEQWTRAAGGRMTAFDPEGAPLADSAGLDPDAPDAGGALEVRQALAQGYGSAVRPSGQEAERTLFVARTVSQDGQTVGVLRWSVPLQPLYAEMRALQRNATLAILAAGLLLAGLLVWERERSAAVLRRLTAMVERAQAQEFTGHVLAFSAGEVGQLTRATNRLVDKYRKASKRRAREKDRLNTVLTHISSGTLILNEFGRVRLINPAAATLLRTTPEKALRQSFVQVVWDHQIAAVYQRCMQSGREESESIDLPDGRFIRVTVTPFLGGSANGYLVILQDLTAMRRLEKVRRDFVSNVSHELRTPLASLAAIVDTLRDGALEDPPAAQRFLDRMEVEVDKMAQMVQELLELSRIESGQIPLRLNPARVRQFVQPSVERLTMQAERAGVSIGVAIPPDLPQVVVDLERLQQVMINLIHNAIKFTPRGGHVQISAGISAERPAMVIVSVRDTGVGIPQSEQARIFERFYKADRSRSGGGTGLGLAIAKHTLQAHGGQIWVESREGQGSTFFLALPLEKTAPSPEEDAAHGAAPTPATQQPDH